MPNTGRVAKKNQLRTPQKIPKKIHLRGDLRLRHVCVRSGLAEMEKKIGVGKV
jgi:hypothetical protein